MTAPLGAFVLTAFQRSARSQRWTNGSKPAAGS